MPSYILDVIFEIIDDKFCGDKLDDVYGSYNSLKEAKSACHEDQKCAFVQDIDCDDEGSFQLCRKFSPLKKSHNGSCIYAHSRSRLGKYCFLTMLFCTSFIVRIS